MKIEDGEMKVERAFKLSELETGNLFKKYDGDFLYVKTDKYEYNVFCLTTSELIDMKEDAEVVPHVGRLIVSKAV